ncbi:MAG: DedA family protein [Leptospiraceae bacterium]|nr:DedA family protein [Leptospiraceae bacterium]MCK6379798.1 DedA family protein [Leptospiraceae bacterium]NUM41423.1 DedA family protein [Leptospiraceae bacterium]
MDFLQILIDFFATYGYISVFLVLILCGLGLPVPEDISLVAGGVISALGNTNEHVMFAVGMAGVLIGDGFVFFLGRFYGEKVLKIKLVSKILTPKRFEEVKIQFEKYGKFVIFVGRFTPGLRMPIFMTAGITKKVHPVLFFTTDFLAAAISVPVWVYLGFYSASNYEKLLEIMHQAQISIIVLVATLVVSFYVFLKMKKRKNK